MITEYTSYDEVRGVLGVGPKEIGDETLALPMWETQLEEYFNETSTYILVTWATLPDVDARSAAERRFANLVRLCASYAVATFLLPSSELFGFLRVGDGRASTERTAKAYENLKATVPAQLAKMMEKLLAALAAIEPAAPVPTAPTVAYVSAVGISNDPVTG